MCFSYFIMFLDASFAHKLPLKYLKPTSIFTTLGSSSQLNPQLPANPQVYEIQLEIRLFKIEWYPL